MLGMSYGDNQDYYGNLVLARNTFENGIGNVNNPKYLKTDNKELSTFLAYTQITMVWVIWFFNQYVILVIMLNFVISVISETYNKVQSRQKMNSYKFKN